MTGRGHAPPKPWSEAPTLGPWPACCSADVARAFDEWMRRYIEEPERFAREFEAVQYFTQQGGRHGRSTSYGRECAAYLQQLIGGG
jgi:hypothetical protein